MSTLWDEEGGIGQHSTGEGTTPAPTPTATNDKNDKRGTTNQGNERTTNDDGGDTGAVNSDYRGQRETRTTRTTDKEAMNDEGNE
jgi:hypothetical protein